MVNNALTASFLDSGAILPESCLSIDLRHMTPFRHTPEASTFAVASTLLEREPELVRRLSIFRGQVNDILADELAAHHIRGQGFPTQHGRHELADVKAAAVILRMLTKNSWDQYDIAVFDAFWKQAMCFDAFADEFEAERHRIQQSVQAARSVLLFNKQTLWP